MYKGKFGDDMFNNFNRLITSYIYLMCFLSATIVLGLFGLIGTVLYLIFK